MKHYYIRQIGKICLVGALALWGGPAADGREISQVPVSGADLLSRPIVGVSQKAQVPQIETSQSLSFEPVKDEKGEKPRRVDGVDDPQWADWEYYGKVEVYLPTLETIFSSVEYNNSEHEVYIRKLINRDETCVDIPWEIRIDGVFGECSLYLDYDYWSKSYDIRTLELPIAIPDEVVAGLPETFAPLEHAELSASSLSGLNLNNPWKFFPESGYFRTGQLMIVVARGIEGTEHEGYTYSLSWSPYISDLDNHGEGWDIDLFYSEGIGPVNYHSYVFEALGGKCELIAKTGANVKGYRLEVIPDDCIYDVERHHFVHIKEYPDFDGKWPHMDIMFSSLASSEDGLSIPIELPGKGKQWVYLCPLTEDGEIASMPQQLTLFVTEDAARWETIGEGTLQDRTVAALCTDISEEDWNNNTFSSTGEFLLENPTWKVMVQKDLDTPGRYRVKNPYVNSPWKSHIDREGDEVPFDCYLYLDATDPGRVILEPSVVDLSYHDVPPMMYNDMLYGKEWTPDGYVYFNRLLLDEFSGVLKDNKIMLRSFTVRHDGGYWYAPANITRDAVGSLEYPDLVLTLPDEAGVESVADGVVELPAEYYNLQGMRIAEPVKGEICIVKRGDQVAKVRY